MQSLVRAGQKTRGQNTLSSRYALRAHDAPSGRLANIAHRVLTAQSQQPAQSTTPAAVHTADSCFRGDDAFEHRSKCLVNSVTDAEIDDLLDRSQPPDERVHDDKAGSTDADLAKLQDVALVSFLAKIDPLVMKPPKRTPPTVQQRQHGSLLPSRARITDGRQASSGVEHPLDAQGLLRLVSKPGKYSLSQKKRMRTALWRFFKFVRGLGSRMSLEFKDNGFPTAVPGDLLVAYVLYVLMPRSRGCMQLKADAIRTHPRNGLLGLFSLMGVQVPHDAYDRMTAQIKYAVANHCTAAQTRAEGQTALTFADAKLMFHRLPEGYALGTEFKALVSIGVNSGRRGIALRSLEWDSLRVTQCTDKCMQINLTVENDKGSNEKRVLLFEGSEGDSSPRNVLYHLRQYARDLLRDENATLADVVNRKRLRGPLFPRSQDAYNGIMREIAVRCGYPTHIRFTMHSFRSGFLLDAVVRCEEDLLTGFSHSRFIAGWAPSYNSSAILYIKEGLQRSVSATRVANGGTLPQFDDFSDSDYQVALEHLGSGVIARNIIDNPARLHDCDIRPPMFTVTQQLQLYAQELLYAAKMLCTSNARQYVG